MHDLACVAHLHSLYSDGTGTVPEIARAARRAGADVVLLTDHDTLEAKRRGEEGWYGKRPAARGRGGLARTAQPLSGLRLDEEIDHSSLDAAGICRAVAEAGGFGFAAHPFVARLRAVRKRVGHGMPFDGLDSEDSGQRRCELWSFVNDTGEAVDSIPGLLRFVAHAGARAGASAGAQHAGVDELCRRRRVVALGGLDAHQFGKRVGRFVPLRIMAYRRSFRFIRTHVLCERAPAGELEHDREQVFGALRDGRCYIAIDSLAPARGFRSRPRPADGLRGARGRAHAPRAYPSRPG